MVDHLSDHTHCNFIQTAYLVRFWLDAPSGPWRASAQSVATGEIIRFGSQQSLFDFLQNELVCENERSREGRYD